MDESAAAERAVQAVERLRNDVGIPGRLRDLGVKQEQLHGFAEKSFGIRRILRVNPRVPSVETAWSVVAARVSVKFTVTVLPSITVTESSTLAKPTIRARRP